MNKLELIYPWLPVEEVTSMQCALCAGANQSEIIFRFSLNNREFRIMRCLHDDIMFLDPQPGERYAHALYEHPTYFGGASDMYGHYVDPQQGRETGKKRLQEFIDNGSVPESFLEIGCGLGYTLDALKEAGSEVYGIEFSESSATACRARGLNVRVATIENPIPNEVAEAGPFDAVALYSVLEHVPNPRIFLSRMRDLVKLDGILVVRVPRMSSRGPWLSLLDHYWHFTEGSLRALLQAEGFEIAAIFPSGTFRASTGEGLESITAFAHPIRT